MIVLLLFMIIDDVLFYFFNLFYFIFFLVLCCVVVLWTFERCAELQHKHHPYTDGQPHIDTRDIHRKEKPWQRKKGQSRTRVVVAPQLNQRVPKQQAERAFTVVTVPSCTLQLPCRMLTILLCTSVRVELHIVIMSLLVWDFFWWQRHLSLVPYVLDFLKKPSQLPTVNSLQLLPSLAYPASE